MHQQEKEFKEKYIINFLSSYMASRYDEDCQNGHKGEPYKHQPVEDAIFLANCAWDQIQHAKKEQNIDKNHFRSLYD